MYVCMYVCMYACMHACMVRSLSFEYLTSFLFQKANNYVISFS